jgi:molybdopterin-guanine dinucleotide biosynthesis protein A
MGGADKALLMLRGQTLIEHAMDPNVDIAASSARRHNIFAVWRASIVERSQSVLAEQGLRTMDDFIARLPHRTVEFASEPFDLFFTINTPDQLARAEALMAGEPAIR